MELLSRAFPERVRVAVLEDANVIVLAGSVALSFAFLNPLPLLIAFVAEAVYLLSVPDSRWYGLRLLRRGDTEAAHRRVTLRDKQFSDPYSAAPVSLQQLEAYRATISLQKASIESDWIAFLHRFDRLIEAQICLQSTTVRVANTITPLENRDIDIAQRIREHHAGLGCYETTRQVPSQTARVAEQLIEASDELTRQTLRFFDGVAREAGTESLPTWQESTERLKRESERITAQNLQHLAQSRPESR